MMRFLMILLVVVVLSVAAPGARQGGGSTHERAAVRSEPYTPEKGSSERKEIMDALRVPVEKNLKQEVIFKIDHLKVMNGWAFLLGAPRRPDGSMPDLRRTPYQTAYENGAYGDDVMGLLHKEKGRWRVVAFVVGATDVAYEGWDRKYRAPRVIFPH